MPSERNPATRAAWAYDQIATAQDPLLVAKIFDAPARDLLDMLRAPSGAVTLDVGTGTGAAALPAMEALGHEGVVVGLDASVEMLRLARASGVYLVVAGEVPGLPFPEGEFDAVFANFVLSHFANYGSALSDMVHVLRPGGRLGVTAWGAGTGEFRRVWQEVAESFTGSERLLKAVHQEIPWEGWFSEPSHVREALEDVGLASVDVQQREYRVSLSTAEYLASREASVEGICMHQMLGTSQWDDFRQRVAEAFRSRVPDPVDYMNTAHIGVGTKV